MMHVGRNPTLRPSFFSHSRCWCCLFVVFVSCFLSCFCFLSQSALVPVVCCERILISVVLLSLSLSSVVLVAWVPGLVCCFTDIGSAVLYRKAGASAERYVSVGSERFDPRTSFNRTRSTGMEAAMIVTVVSA